MNDIDGIRRNKRVNMSHFLPIGDNRIWRQRLFVMVSFIYVAEKMQRKSFNHMHALWSMALEMNIERLFYFHLFIYYWLEYTDLVRFSICNHSIGFFFKLFPKTEAFDMLTFNKFHAIFSYIENSENIILRCMIIDRHIIIGYRSVEVRIEKKVKQNQWK